MNFPSRGNAADDEGQATLFLVIGLMFSLLAVMSLFVRLGTANDLRSQAQTAADSAALAAAGNTQDRMAKALAGGAALHFSSWNEDSGETAADRYAKKNRAVVTDVRASDNMYGFSGNHIRVVVRGAQCQRELEEDRSRNWGDTTCDGTEKKQKIETFSGEAAAVARVDAPNCSLRKVSPYSEEVRPFCAGKWIYNVADARSVIRVKLVDEEGKYLFDPTGGLTGDNSGLAGGDQGACDAPAGGGNITPLMCATNKAILKKFPPLIAKGPGCYRADGGGGEHPLGRACDYMVSTGTATGADKALGDATAAWIQQHADKLGIKYIIWSQRIWSPVRASEGWRSMEDRGSPTENHYDHVHVSVN